LALTSAAWSRWGARNGRWDAELRVRVAGLGGDFGRIDSVRRSHELVTVRIERQLHVQEKLRCSCGETIITADAPAKVFDKTRFGPTFIAQVAVSKCADSLPLYRGCFAHVRRHFFDARLSAPEAAKRAMDFILEQGGARRARRGSARHT